METSPYQSYHLGTNVAEPEPTRRTVYDAVFMRDVYAIVGRAANCVEQHRAITIETSSIGAVISWPGAHSGLLVIGPDLDLITGHVGGHPQNDDRQKHGAIWTAVAAMLDRLD